MSHLQRASNACDFCRSRKIKCDEKAPSCSHCEKRGYKCVYKEVLPTKLERTLTELFHKVEKLDSKLDAVITQGKSFRGDQPGVEKERSAEMPPSEKQSNEQNKHPEKSIFKEEQILSLLEDLDSYRDKDDSQNAESENVIIKADTVLSPSVSESFLTDHSHESYLIPTTDFDQANTMIDNWLKAEGLSENADATLDFDSSTVGIFKKMPSLSAKALELMTEDEFSLTDRFDPSKLPKVMHFPKKTVDNAIQSYLNHIYPRYPAVCDDFISKVHTEVTNEGLTASFSSCIFLLILAIGSAVNQNETSERAESLGEEQHINQFHQFWFSSEYQDKHVKKIEDIPPGWEYFWMVLGMREKLISLSKPSIKVVAVRLLSSIYYLKICNVSNYSKELRLASDTLFDVLTYYIQVEPDMLKSNNTVSEALLRYFWILLHLEREIAGVFSLKLSRLAELQGIVNTPKGCRQNLFRDRDSIYAFCFMSIVSLTNIRARATAIIPSVNSSTFDEVLEQIENYSDSLQIWRSSLPLELQWNDCHPRSAIKSGSDCVSELLIVRLNYHLSVISVARLLLMKIKYFHQASICFSSLKISAILENCMTSMSHYVHVFLQLSIADLTPFICHEAMQVLMLIEKFRYIINYREESARISRADLEKHSRDRYSFLNMERSTFVDCFLKIQPFAWHSPFILKEYELCKVKLLG